MSFRNRIDAYTSKAKQIYQNEGFRALMKGSFKHIKHNPKKAFMLKGRNYQTDKRIDTEIRTKIITEKLDSQDQNAVDIGANQGIIASSLADEGIFTVGIERDKISLISANDLHGLKKSCGFVRFDVNPRTISRLPSFDVVLLLTIYHHWCREFGMDDSEAMLRELAEDSRKIFIEIPDEPLENMTNHNGMEDNLIKEYQSYFRTVFADDVDVEFLQKVGYDGGERDDLIFLLHCGV